MAVYIARSDGLTSASPKELAVQRTLVEDLGGTFHHVIGDDIPAALLDFARGVQRHPDRARRLAAARSWQYVFGPGVGATVARDSGPDLDVHLITHDEAGKGRGLPGRPGRPPRPVPDHLGLAGRLWPAPSCSTWLLSGVVPDVGLANDMLLFLTLTVAAALLGGLLPALASAVVGSLLLNWYFTPPVHTLTIADPKNIVAIAIFVGVAVSVASVVDLAARRTHQAARLRAESEILSFLAGSVLRGETSLEALLERVRETFGMESVALLERESDVDPWTCAGSVGPRPCADPGGRGRRRAGRRPHGPRADRPGAARRGPPGAGRLRRPGRRRTGPPAPAAARPTRPGNSPRATASAPPCSPPSATTCAPRSPGSRPPSPPCAPTTSSGPRRTRRNCWRPSRRAPTASTTSSATSSTCPASRPAPSPR